MNWDIRNSHLAFRLCSLLRCTMSKMCEEQGNYFDKAHYTAGPTNLHIKEEQRRKEKKHLNMVAFAQA